MNPRAAHFGADEVDLRNISFTTELLACIPADLARRYRVLPIFESPGSLGLALADPADLEAIDSIHRTLQRDLLVSVAEASQLDEFIGRLYGSGGRG